MGEDIAQLSLWLFSQQLYFTQPLDDLVALHPVALMLYVGREMVLGHVLVRQIILVIHILVAGLNVCSVVTAPVLKLVSTTDAETPALELVVLEQTVMLSIMFHLAPVTLASLVMLSELAFLLLVVRTCIYL